MSKQEREAMQQALEAYEAGNLVGNDNRLVGSTLTDNQSLTVQDHIPDATKMVPHKEQDQAIPAFLRRAGSFGD